MAVSSSSSCQEDREAGPGRTKRRSQVIVACNECRRRKVKCDGLRPHCQLCSLRNIRCCYDADPDAPPIIALKRKYDQLRRESVERDELIKVLLTASDGESGRLLAAIRSGISFPAALRAARYVRSTSAANRGRSPWSETALQRHSPCKCSIAERRPSDAATRSTRPTLRRVQSFPDHTEERLGKGLTLGASPLRSAADDRLSSVSAQMWGVKYLDDDAFRRVLSSYLAWDHPAYRFFDESAFLEGLRTGPSEFCSSLLVHSVIFVGCNSFAFVDAERAAVVEHFALVEAQRLWVIEITSDSPATVAAGLMIHFGLGCMGLDREGYSFLAQALHMSENLGLYSASLAPNVYDPSFPLRTRARLILAWGCFTYRCLFCLIMRDMSLSGATTVPPVRLVPEDNDHDCHLWQPWPACEPRLPCLKNEIHRAKSAFYPIIAEILPLRFRYSSREPSLDYLQAAVAIYERLRAWYADLPPALCQLASATPHLFSLHHDYHYVVADLFSPFVPSSGTTPPTQSIPYDASLPPELPLSISSTARRRLRYLVEEHDRLYHAMPISAAFFASRLFVCFESMPCADMVQGDGASRFAFLICLLRFRRISKHYPYHRHTLTIIQRAATRMGAQLPPAARRLFDANEVERQRFRHAHRVHSSWPADINLIATDLDAGRLSNLIKSMEDTST